MVECARVSPSQPFASLDLDRLGATAHGIANRLTGNRYPVDDAADLRADLILAALERWPKFDPSRGRPMAFLAIAMTRAGTSILRAQRTAKRGGRSKTVPLDEAMSAVADRLPAFASASQIPRRELELDVRAAIDALPKDLATVCNDFLEAATDGRRRPSLGVAATAALRRHFESVGFSEHTS